MDCGAVCPEQCADNQACAVDGDCKSSVCDSGVCRSASCGDGATNELIQTYDGAVGVKTGFTFQAGLVLVAAAERDDRAIYVVVMGSEGVGAHFEDAAALLDHGFGGHELVRAVAGESVFDGGRLRRTALLESQFHIAALLARPQVSEAAPPVASISDPETLPGIVEAFGWLFGWGADD